MGNHAYIVVQGEVIAFSDEDVSRDGLVDPKAPDYLKKKTISLLEENSQHSCFKSSMDESGRPKYFTAHYKKVYTRGNLIGEVALLDKPQRKLSVASATDCIVLELNQVAFDMAFKEHIKREQEELTNFVYDNFPGMPLTFTRNQVHATSHILFQECTLSKD